MKKNLLILILPCMISCMAFAQSPGRLFTSPIASGDNIIRYDPATGFHVTYTSSPTDKQHVNVICE